MSRSLEYLTPGRYVAVSATFPYACGLTEHGAVVCSQADEYFNPPQPPLARYTAISTATVKWLQSGLHYDSGACGLTDSGDVLCWGAPVDSLNEYVMHYPGDYVAVQAYGNGNFCALTADGALTNRQGGDCGFAPADASTRYTAINLGLNHDCALTTTGAARCVTSPLGFWTMGAVTVLTPPDPAPGRYTAISVGDGYACALKEDGEAACWSEEAHTVPPPDPAPGRYVALSNGWGHGCALTEAGEGVCWGWNNWGQVEVPPGRYIAISAGDTDTCALTAAGEAVCWGRGVAELPPGPYTAISVGSFYGFERGEVCALTEAGEAVCAGWDALEETPPGPFVAISLGRYGYACALTAAGEAVCWGRNREGQTDVPPGRYREVDAGAGWTCAITEAGERSCWGSWEEPSGVGWDGRSGQWSSRGAPYTAISTGSGHACALMEDGEMVCWESWTDRDRVPRPSPPPGRYTAISVGKSQRESQDCALSADGQLVCWGDLSDRPPSEVGYTHR